MKWHWGGVVMKDKKKLIIFPFKPQLPHYTELLRKEAEKNMKFIEDVQRRAQEIKKNVEKRIKDK